MLTRLGVGALQTQHSFSASSHRNTGAHIGQQHTATRIEPPRQHNRHSRYRRHGVPHGRQPWCRRPVRRRLVRHLQLRRLRRPRGRRNACGACAGLCHFRSCRSATGQTGNAGDAAGAFPASRGGTRLRSSSLRCPNLPTSRIPFHEPADEGKHVVVHVQVPLPCRLGGRTHPRRRTVSGRRRPAPQGRPNREIKETVVWHRLHRCVFGRRVLGADILAKGVQPPTQPLKPHVHWRLPAQGESNMARGERA